MDFLLFLCRRAEKIADFAGEKRSLSGLRTDVLCIIPRDAYNGFRQKGANGQKTSIKSRFFVFIVLL